MRIAFVGKGGSGKTTISSLFSSYITGIQNIPVTFFDADINRHVAGQFGFKNPPSISDSHAIESIKSYLRGNNKTIRSLAEFRKTTPPSLQSNIICFPKIPEIFEPYRLRVSEYLNIFTVGTYEPETVGASCYHNNLAILENILSHSYENNSITIIDMVAGTDAFASSLHAQFDLLLVVTAPTRHSVEVFHEFISLAESAGVMNRVFAIGNQVRSEDDQLYIADSIGHEKLIGHMEIDPHILSFDRDPAAGVIDVQKLSNTNRKTLDSIFQTLKKVAQDPNERLPKLHELHRKYIVQNFITKQFGDLSGQIDWDFHYPKNM